MLLPTNDGIRCDLCGTSSRKKFIYYSADCSKVHADTPKKIVNAMPSDESYDICEKCYNDLVDRCRKNIRDARKDAIRCDLCPKFLSGTFDLTRMVIAKVTVDSVTKAEGPLDVHHKFMDFNICQICWSSIIEMASKTRESIKQKGDWS